MSELDPFEHDDAAYVLGALEPDDARAFEAHLAGCAACTARVHALRGTAGVLAGLGPDDLAGLDELDGLDESLPGPESLVPELARRVAARQRRRRWGTAALGTIAAAAVIALAVVLGTGGGSGPAPSAAGRPMTAVGPAAPVRATAALAAEQWGTRIVLDCHYAAGTTPPGYPTSYALRVIERDGSRHELGSWTLSGPGDTRFVSGVAVPAAQIRTVQITLLDGTPVLQLAAG